MDTAETPKKGPKKGPGIVGDTIRKRRESLNLSQRALGLLFEPAVTTQFISNIERGVTPLPPAHVGTLAKALQIPEIELMSLMEREYTQRLSDRVGKPEFALLQGASPTEAEQFQKLWRAYQGASSLAQEEFRDFVKRVLKMDLKGTSG